MNPKRAKQHGQAALPSKVLQGGYASFVVQLCRHNMDDNTEKLPRKFLQYYGSSIPNPIVLQIPNGKKWNIELNCYEGDAWLDCGWKKFLTDLSLVPTTSLFFQFNENNVFKVTAYQFKCCDEVKFQSPNANDADRFRVTIKNYMIQADSLPLPRSHFQGYLGLQEDHDILLTLGTGARSATLTTDPKKSTCFVTDGWKAFATEHNIKDDQECEITLYVAEDDKIMFSLELIN